MPQHTAAVRSEAPAPQVVQIVYQIIQQPQPVYVSGQGGQQPYLSYAMPPAAGGGTTPPHTVSVPNPSLALMQSQQGGGAFPPQPQPMEQGRAQPVTQQQEEASSQKQQPAIPPSSPAPVAQQQQQQPAPAWDQQPRTVTPWAPTPPPFRESSGSAVWALFFLVPALLLMIVALGQEVFADSIQERYYGRPLYTYRAVYSPPRVMLWNVEKCSFNNDSQIRCNDMSFDDAKLYNSVAEEGHLMTWTPRDWNTTVHKKGLISTSCTGYVITTAVMVILSVLCLSLCIVLGIQEVRGKEPFPYACAAATVVGLLFTGLSWGLPVAALERNVCVYIRYNGYANKYVISGAVHVSIAAFTLLGAVLVGYIPRVCRWGCCTRRADEVEEKHAEPPVDSGNAVTAVTNDDGTASASEKEEANKNGTYSSVTMLFWFLLCLSLSAAVLATPVLQHRRISGKKLYLWNANDCTSENTPCTSESIESASSSICVAHIGSAAAFALLAMISVMFTFLFQIQELRKRPVFKFAPIAASLFGALCFGAAFGIITTAKARYYCSPYTSISSGYILLLVTMCLLLLTPSFRLGKLFPIACCLCYENPAYRDAVEMANPPPLPAPQGSVPQTMEPVTGEEYSERDERPQPQK